MKIILSILLVINNAFATECKEPVSLLKEGEKASCTGYLFSPEQEKIAAQAYDDKKYFEELSEKLQKRIDLSNKQVDILEKRISLYVEQTDILSKQIVNREQDDFWKKTLYFGLGVLATGIAFYGTSQINR